MNNPDITYFAETDARNSRVRFGIKNKDRAQHMYIIGKTGMGKSTTLENMAIQDIQNGHGLAFLDPHGKTADLLLEYIPEHRVKDVIYFAPFDMEHPISFNVMEDVGADKRHLVTSGLMSAFKKIWVDAWSARMEYILNNILLALLEYPDSTLIGVNRMLADKDYRKKVVDNITDPSVKLFWTDEFAKYSENYMREAGAAIQNKIGQFVSNPLIRNIIGQPKSTFDIRELMDNNKIIIINLSKGLMGEANANLLGSMLITKIYLGALSRADANEKTLEKLPPFYLYVDEFQNFANESFAGILSEARKYKLCLTVAHQYIEQMSEEVRAAVFGNVGTMLSFRVGAYDAEVLEKEFAPQFTAEDMVNLGKYQIYLKLMIDAVTSPPFSATTLNQIERPIVSFRKEILDNSHKQYAHPRAEVEKTIKDWHAPVNPPQEQGSGGGRGRAPAAFNGPISGGGNGGGGRGVNSGGNGGRGGDAPRRDDRREPAPRAMDAESSANLNILAKSVQMEHAPSHNRRPSVSQSGRGERDRHSHSQAERARGVEQVEQAGQTEQRQSQPVSLNHLDKHSGRHANTQKEASHEHIQSLREALKAYVRPSAGGEKKEEPKKDAEPEKDSQSHAHTHSAKTEHTESKHPHEVPKETLMKILKGEENTTE